MKRNCISLKSILVSTSMALAMTVSIASCDTFGSSKKKLQAQYDSLVLVHNNSKQEIDEMFSLINEVEANISDIATAENKVKMGSLKGDLDGDKRQQLMADIEYLRRTLAENKAKLIEYQAKLERNNISISSLNKKIRNLEEVINQKEEVIAKLNNALTSKELYIAQQDSVIGNLSETNRTQDTTIALQDKQLKEQEQRLYTAYYCFGTSSELKTQKIIKSGGLFSSMKVLPEGFNKDYFLQIDTREVQSISLFATKAKVLTNHPQNSYALEKDNDGNLILMIKDADAFWTNSKYLVVEVK